MVCVVVQGRLDGDVWVGKVWCGPMCTEKVSVEGIINDGLVELILNSSNGSR